MSTAAAAPAPARLATHVWVGALLRRAAAVGAFATVLRRGDATAGAVILIARSPAGAVDAWSRAPGADGSGWTISAQGSRGDETKVDQYLARQARYDPDLWIVELVVQEFQPFIAELSQSI